jgi:biotin-(acetyl-CoA carboxylase) ligase
VAGTLGLKPTAVEVVLEQLMSALERWLAASDEDVLTEVRGRDALRGEKVRWAGGHGQAAGIDGEGRLLVLVGKDRVALEAGEVHLVRS